MCKEIAQLNKGESIVVTLTEEFEPHCILRHQPTLRH